MVSYANTLDALRQEPRDAPQLLRVLIAEDNPPDAELVVATLKRAGYRLLFDVEDALERFETRLTQREYDVVISDHNLQSWTGRDALAALQASGQDVPFLMVTASLGDEAAVDYLKAGASDYLLKSHLERLPAAVKRALQEKAHRAETARLQTAILCAKRDWEITFDAVPDLVLNLSADGLIQRANRAVTETTGRRFPEIIGKQCWEVLHGFSEKCEACPHRRFQQSGLAERGDIEHAISGKFFEVTCTPMLGPDGNPHGSVVVMRDVTERRKVEEQVRRLNIDLEQRVQERTMQLASLNRELELRNHEVERANRMKSLFLASMSHELRTPLNAILGFSTLLTEQNSGTLSPKQVRFVEHIQRGGQHLLQLINDILDLSKIEAGRMELRPERFAIAAALPEVLSLIRPLAAAKHIQLHSPADAGLRVYADPVRFKQILYNLLSNAVKFTPEGGQVGIEAQVQGGELCLTVWDTGIGIAAGDLEDIFQEFHQVAETTKGVREGTGLGLAITKRLVEQHRGRVSVESKPGEGSRFFVRLPADAPDRGGANGWLAQS
jgi:PAS domain S-box-containing protein